MGTCWPTRNFSLLKRCFARLPTHLIPDRQDVGVAHVGGGHASGGMNCSIVTLTNLGRTLYIYTCSYRWNICAVYPSRVLLTRSTTAHLTSGFLQTWNSIPSRFSNVWSWVFKNSFPLSVRTHTGRLRIGFVYLGSRNIDSSAAATSFPVFVCKGMLCRYFKKHVN